jgi:FkbM family methyltransferase
MEIFAPRLLWRLRARSWQTPNQEPELALVPLLAERHLLSIDVGASLGVYTLAMLGHSRAVISFEARVDAAEALRQMYARAPVDVQAVALSDTSGSSSMRVCTTEPGRSTLERRNPLSDRADVEVIPIPVRTLDSYALSGVGLIKIDVEGHEEAVLAGARTLLSADLPALIIEIEERHNPGGMERITGMLSSLGYLPFSFEDGRLVPHRGVGINVVFLPPEVRRRARVKRLLDSGSR